MTFWLILWISTLIITVVIYGYLGWLKLHEWLTTRREARRQRDLEARLLQLRREEDALKTELRFASLEARRRLIRASFQAAQHSADDQRPPASGSRA